MNPFARINLFSAALRRGTCWLRPGWYYVQKGDLIGRIGILQIGPVDFEHRV